PPPPPSSTLAPYTTLFRSEYRRLAMDQYPKEEIGEGKVQTDAEKKQISLANRVRDGYRAFLRAMVDSGEAVSRAAKAFQDESLRSEEHTSELQSRFDIVCR